jgi:hypothetical protein
MKMRAKFFIDDEGKAWLSHIDELHVKKGGKGSRNNFFKNKSNFSSSKKLKNDIFSEINA